MTTLVRAELLKLRSISSTWWMVAATLVLVALETAAFTFGASRGNASMERGDPDLLAHTMTSMGAVSALVMVLGIMAVTQEYRFGTATPTFLVTPVRGVVIVAKILALTLTGLAIGACAAALGLPLAVLFMRQAGEHPHWDALVWHVVLGGCLVAALYGLLGVAIGALVRNQVAAIAGALTWLLIAEALVSAVAPRLAAYLPGGATSEVLQGGSWFGQTLGPPWQGVLLLISYAVVLAGLGVHVTMRRDLT